jgi:pyruvate dehydrogenase E1 component alpha subunit
VEAGVPEVELEAVEAEVRAQVDAAEKVAREAPDPDPSAAMTQLWADGGSDWRS